MTTVGTTPAPRPRRDETEPVVGRVLIAVGAIALLVAALAVAIEAFLIKATQFRLSHGDGRERNFRAKPAP